MIMLKKGMVGIMKKYVYVLVILLFCIIGVDSRQVKAYTVTMEKDGIYAEVVPDSFINNVVPIFKKYVNKAMKYYNKYKDADDYTYVSEVPEEQRDFIPVVKQIQDADEIIIRNPFYIYYPGEEDGVACEYCFFAEKNGKKLCMFSVDIESDTGEVSLWYDKIMDGFFTNDDKITGETLFYGIDKIIYAETPDGVHVVRNKKEASWGEEHKMIGGDETDWEAVAEQEAEEEMEQQKFEKKSYSEKKDEILAYLAGTKNEKSIKKVEKKLKQELGDEYIWSEEDTEESDKTGIYIVIGIGIMLIGVIGGIILLKKRKKE